MQPAGDEGFDATRWIESIVEPGHDAMTLLAVDDRSRPARVARVRDDIESGRYRPPADAVAERLLAFLGPVWSREA